MQCTMSLRFARFRQLPFVAHQSIQLAFLLHSGKKGAHVGFGVTFVGG